MILPQGSNNPSNSFVNFQLYSVYVTLTALPVLPLLRRKEKKKNCQAGCIPSIYRRRFYNILSNEHEKRRLTLVMNERRSGQRITMMIYPI